MTAVNLTEAEEAELLPTLDVADPPSFSAVQVGRGKVRPAIASAWSHVDGALDACGVSVRSVGRRAVESVEAGTSAGDVEFDDQLALDVLDQPGNVTLAQKLVDTFETAESTREFGLEWSFAQCGGNWYPNG